MDRLLPYDAALAAVDDYVARVKATVARQVSRDGRVDADLVTRHQASAHGFAWVATYAAGLRALLGWARALEARRPLAEVEALILATGFAEYVAQIAGGLPMSQAEMVRPADFGLDAEAGELRTRCADLIAAGDPARICALLQDGAAPDRAFDDELLEMMADQFRRFVDQLVAPHAHGWHLRNEYIPLDVVEEMARLGVFGLTVPEEFGGSGLGKLAMCLVSEELSRGYIGV
ncbi:MAG: acyl-CoA dehydrogenase, partial [Candidatus Accumulibacter sp.]|nr:acyl-CoA dehydrogenase [Accumulibacter sp.]